MTTVMELAVRPCPICGGPDEGADHCSRCTNGLDPAYAGLRRGCDHHGKVHSGEGNSLHCQDCGAKRRYYPVAGNPDALTYGEWEGGRGWLLVSKAEQLAFLLGKAIAQGYIVQFCKDAEPPYKPTCRLGMVECDGNVVWLPYCIADIPQDALADAEGGK